MADPDRALWLLNELEHELASLPVRTLAGSYNLLDMHARYLTAMRGTIAYAVLDQERGEL